jgi:DNA invertase Pin-like site-specific DNA recombinase
MKVAYLRNSNKDKSKTAQLAALSGQKCDRMVEEHLPHLVKKRPALEALLPEMKEGDTLVVWGFERIAVSAKDLRELIAKLHKRGITLHSLKENFVSTSDRASLMMSMLHAVVEAKVFVDAEHSAVVQKTMKAKGPQISPHRKLWDRDIQMILALLEQKIPKYQIAKKFGISEKNLNKRLRDPRYMNEVVFRQRKSATAVPEGGNAMRARSTIDAEGN